MDFNFDKIKELSFSLILLPLKSNSFNSLKLTFSNAFISDILFQLKFNFSKYGILIFFKFSIPSFPKPFLLKFNSKLLKSSNFNWFTLLNWNISFNSFVILLFLYLLINSFIG